MLAKDKKGTWAKVARKVAAKGKNNEHTRATIKRSLRQLRKINEEEAAKELLESVQERKQQVEEELWREVDEYIFSWEPGKRR